MRVRGGLDAVITRQCLLHGGARGEVVDLALQIEGWMRRQFAFFVEHENRPLLAGIDVFYPFTQRIERDFQNEYPDRLAVVGFDRHGRGDHVAPGRRGSLINVGDVRSPVLAGTAVPVVSGEIARVDFGNDRKVGHKSSARVGEKISVDEWKIARHGAENLQGVIPFAGADHLTKAHAGSQRGAQIGQAMELFLEGGGRGAGQIEAL